MLREMLAIDSNDEQIDMVTVILEPQDQLRDDVSISIILGIIKANCVNQAFMEMVKILIDMYY